MALTTKITIGIVATLTAALDLATSTTPLAYPLVYEWPNGVAADQADMAWHDRRTIAASGTDDLDLAGGLTDAYGATITFVKIRALLVVADAANTNAVILGNATTNAWGGGVATTGPPLGHATHTTRVHAGGAVLYLSPDAGFGVTAGSIDVLRVANSGAGTEVIYDIIAVGTLT
jgi:hypothetical protein